MLKALALLVVLALALPLAGEAQPQFRIGFVSFNQATNERLRNGFSQGLRDLGYVEGGNIVIEWRDVAGKPERLDALVAELVALKVDVIVTVGTLASLAAKRATSTIPIVFPTVGDPVADGLVASLARPGGNVTGVANRVGDLIGKCLQLLKQAAPGIKRVAVLNQPGSSSKGMEKVVVSGLRDAGRSLGLAIELIDARGGDDIDAAFREMARRRANALFVLPYGTLLIERRRIVALAAKHRLPAMYGYREPVEDGGLMSYGPDLAESFRRSATYVDRILKGAKPADLPVEQLSKFELLINLKTAKALGLTIPQSVLQQADRLIE